VGKVIFMLLALCGTAHASEDANNYLSTDRYTKLKLQATRAQMEPLDVVVQLKFPVNILRTEDAMNYILDDSGYSLIDPKLWTEEMQIMMNNTIAAIHRDMTATPMSVINMLGVLAGSHFRIVKDPLRRKINFVLEKEYRGLIDG